MTKWLSYGLLLMPWALPAVAQTPVVTPQIQALQQTVLDLTGQRLDWQAATIAAQRQIEADKAQIADLQRQLNEAKAPPKVAEAPTGKP